MPATAADLPSDLDELILSFLARSPYGGQGSQATTSQLSLMALVCRKWAQLCQKAIFQTVLFRSQRACEAFATLASHRCSQISRYVDTVILLAHGPSLHVMIHHFPPSLITNLDITVHVSPGRGTYTPQLPLAIPLRPLEIHRLTVISPHFKSLRHFARYLWDQPVRPRTISIHFGLWELSPRYEYADDLYGVLPPRRRLALSPSRLAMLGTRDPWTVVPLALATNVGQLGARLIRHDWHVLARIVHSLTRAMRIDNGLCVKFKAPGEADQLWGERHASLFGVLLLTSLGA